MEAILIVDDDLNLCKVLAEELTEMGYKTSYVTSADAALEFIQHEPINLMLLDLKMPEKDGFEVLRELKVRTVTFSVIVLTAYADVVSAMEAARMGATDFISKPYDFDELLITIRKVLQKDV
ncbi:MAG: response regulator [Ignavibacteria bacterium]|nr:response regulator [Ignavibacteria bacterium]